MLRALKIAAGVLAGAAMLVGALAPDAAAQTRVGPRQHFIGFVNGSNNDPVVTTVCPGPSSPHRTGPVAGGQTLQVMETDAGHGYTGVFGRVYVWVVPASGTTVSAEQTFAVYGTAKAFPRGARVPCQGPGQVEFSSCPYLAPCAAGWIPEYVQVRFVNIAA